MPEEELNEPINVGTWLSRTAAAMPDDVAVAAADGRDPSGKPKWQHVTFRQLDDDTNRLAAGLAELGIRPGMRIALLVRPGIDFIALVYALFKSGAVSVLIDPGMGRRRMLECLADVEPDGFVAIPVAHAVRVMCGRRFGNAHFNVTVGRRWFWGGTTLRRLRNRSSAVFVPPSVRPEDPAAVIFTSGATGPAKGVQFEHRAFQNQVIQIRDFYDIQPGGVDVACFPLFALFNGAMGTTTVLPDMDMTRPADVDPRNIVEAVQQFRANQAFASPAVWNAVGRHCEAEGIKLPTLKRVLSAGAPVPPHVLRRMNAAIAPDGEMHTPYGATEALPVASISASEVLGETADRSAAGGGTCVGGRFPGIEWKVIRMNDEPIATLDAAEPLPAGEIGELIVRGPVVTREYVTRVDANRMAKIADGDTVWHRMGDVGYLDNRDRFWFCGRKVHRVVTAQGPMYPVPCEAIFNGHERVFRSALVGVGPPGRQMPVIVVETWPECRCMSAAEAQELVSELLERAEGNPLTDRVKHVLLRDGLPVDVRHNAKIDREELATWATSFLTGSGSGGPIEK